MAITTFAELIAAAQAAAKQRLLTLAVAQADDLHVVEAVAAAEGMGLIRSLCITAETQEESAARAVAAIRRGEADMLMKGRLPTATLMKAVLQKETGLRTGRALSHACAFEIPGWQRLLFVTDAALNVAPDLARKAEIVRNQVRMAQRLGIARPKVAALAAIESLNPDMIATLDGHALQEMAERGELGDCDLQGPLALDLAVSQEAGQIKGIGGPVVGEADILLAPNLEVGNVLHKSLVYFAGARAAGLIMGAHCPIVLLSRSDSAEAKLSAIALAVLTAH